MSLLLLAATLAGEIDAAGLKRLVAAHKGRPVVVSFWATWCEPCIKEFPDLMALARERPDVAVVSVSIDDREGRGALEAFVAKHQPPFPVYARAPGDDQAFIDDVDPEWSGVVPATLVFGPDGRRTMLLQGEHSRAEIEKGMSVSRKR